MKRSLWILGAVLAAGLVVSILVLGQRTLAPGGGTTLSPRDESRLDSELAPLLSNELGGLDPGAEVQGMASSVGARIAAFPGATGGPYRFQFLVLADTVLAEAYALPGGSIFLTRGLLDRLENEAQLAGVLAHQVSHVLSHHAAKRFRRSDRGDAAVAKVLDLQYSNEEETEADTLSVRLLGEAGYDPRALVDLVRISVEATHLSGERGFSSRHPGGGDRRRVLEEAIARAYPRGVPSTLTLGRWFAPEPPDSGEPDQDADSMAADSTTD